MGCEGRAWAEGCSAGLGLVPKRAQPCRLSLWTLGREPFRCAPAPERLEGRRLADSGIPRRVRKTDARRRAEGLWAPRPRAKYRPAKPRWRAGPAGSRRSDRILRAAVLLPAARLVSVPKTDAGFCRLRPSAPWKSVRPDAALNAAGHAGRRRSFGSACVDAVQNAREAHAGLHQALFKPRVVLVSVAVT